MRRRCGGHGRADCARLGWATPRPEALRKDSTVGLNQCTTDDRLAYHNVGMGAGWRSEPTDGVHVSVVPPKAVENLPWRMLPRSVRATMMCCAVVAVATAVACGSATPPSAPSSGAPTAGAAKRRIVVLG